MRHDVINLVLTVSIWMFLIIGAASQCFVSSQLIQQVLK